MVSNVRYPLEYKMKRDSVTTGSILESNTEMVDSMKKILQKKYPMIYLNILKMRIIYSMLRIKKEC